MSVVINGSAGVTTNSGAVYDGISRGTAVASTSGTSIDCTSIPSWVKRITVMFNGVSTNGSSNWLVQLGTSGGVVSSGYLGACSSFGGTSANNSTGFAVFNAPASTSIAGGSAVLTNLSGNVWTIQGVLGQSDAAGGRLFGGYVTLSGTLDRVRITTVNGTDTFDAGSVNIDYE